MFEKLQGNLATRDIPVILLTSKVLARDRRRFADLSVAGVITKPFNSLTIWQQIEDLLGWQALFLSRIATPLPLLMTNC
jgi:CheY-like chemotaxis protein